MMSTDTRQQIETALLAFSSADLLAAAIGLLTSLGYQSEKTLDLDNTPVAFLAEFDKRERKLRKDKALFERWKSVEFLFQIADDEVQSAGGQAGLDFQTGFDAHNYQSYLFFALDLEKNHYTRTQLADITREINLLFDMPAMLLMRHNGALTFSIIDRRLHKKDQSRDVLEKVKLIKDIRYQEPHRAHIEILHDLSLPALMAKHACRDFEQLHEAWRTTLDTNELNKKFYRELADWYFWAREHVEFPDDVEKDQATRNATNVIRLLTRLIFCWFLKEKGLIPDYLFSKHKLADVLKSLKEDESTYYRAILQNLFFGTLNQRMNTGGQENRKFTSDGPFLERKDEYGIKNMYRYQKLFAIAEEEAVKLFSDIPFLNGGLFDCLDKENDSGKVVYIDGFTRNARKQPKVPNSLFFSGYQTIDLSEAYGDKKRKKEKVRGLINLLDSYKFTVTENTPIEEEIALDPELLGKVFENLLASYNPETGTTARKQTGSFYTPREIVNYMVDESLIAYLTQALSKGEGSGASGRREPGWKTTDKASYAGVKGFTQQNRRNLTEAEAVLWAWLRNRQIGVKFRRQHAIDKYIADFVCLEKKLVVEADGLVHDKQKDADAVRDEILLKQGYRTLRFSNEEIIDHTDNVIDAIKSAIEEQGESGVSGIEGRTSPPLEGIEGRLREVFAYTEKVHPFDEEEVDSLIDAIDNCKILDPACGSGAFPMGILHKLVFLLGKLDPNNERWKQKQIDKLDSVSMREELVRIFEENDDDYGRKLYLIENCIYGVDIQPIAIQISKLRFFISLICDQRTNKNKAQNCGVRPLPNLETKFVAANTLISLDRGQDQGLLTDQRLPKLEKELTAVRHRHFASQRRRDKLALQRRDAELREEIASVLAGGGMTGEASHQLAAWDPYDQNTSAPFFDAEWMYGITGGFDVVIGNPPYIQIQKFSKVQKETWVAQNYRTYTATADIYCLFYERGAQLLRTNGHLCFITSNQWMRTAYGKKLRQFIGLETCPKRLLDLGEGVFDATTNTNILLLEKNNLVGMFLATNITDRHSFDSCSELSWVTLKLTNDAWIISSQLEQGVMSKMKSFGIPLKDWNVKINYGIKTGFNEGFIIDGCTRSKLISMDQRVGEIIKPVLRGRDIKRYRVNFEDLWLINVHNGYGNVPAINVEDYSSIRGHLDEVERKRTAGELGEKAKEAKGLLRRDDQGKTPYNLRSCAYIPEFGKEKITWGNLSQTAQFALVDASIFINAPSPLITPANRYLLAVLNSKLGDFYIRCLGVIRSGGFFEYKPMFVEQLPVPDISGEEQRPFAVLADKIIKLKKENQEADVFALEAEIDQLVYTLYDLTSDEIRIVKGLDKD